jgi:uncharacterized protein YbbC (DUF1343 family)
VAWHAAHSDPPQEEVQHPVRPGIYPFAERAAELRNIPIAVVANHTSLINGTHLVDTLVAMGARVVRVFAPEHGFRGDKPDGARIADETDPRTGIPVASLYGKNKKPTPQQLEGVDHVIFDIQDVGARFYTYISTLHYVMEACAELGIPITVLDRPNPHAHYVDGPVLNPNYKSFVGMHPVPVVYGMTIGEYAQMINGEGWLANGVQARLNVIPCENYTRHSTVILPVPPSPNLQTMEAIWLYPSLCFFEGTQVSVGRGTDAPFTAVGEPTNTSGNFTFTPRSIPGVSTSPPHLGKLCRGYRLEQPHAPSAIQWEHLVRMYRESGQKETFFLKSGFFDQLAGTDALRKMVVAGASQQDIANAWKPEVELFKATRSKYLIYPE